MASFLYDGPMLTRSTRRRLARFTHPNPNPNPHPRPRVLTPDIVGLLMENRPEFIIIGFALNKIGAVASYLNTNLRLKHLLHCITISTAKTVIFGTELTSAVEQIVDTLQRDGSFIQKRACAHLRMVAHGAVGGRVRAMAQAFACTRTAAPPRSPCRWMRPTAWRTTPRPLTRRTAPA